MRLSSLREVHAAAAVVGAAAVAVGADEWTPPPRLRPLAAAEGSVVPRWEERQSEVGPTEDGGRRQCRHPR